MLLFAAALALLVQDPPPGEVVRTAPPPAPAGTLADPFAPAPDPEPVRSTLDLSAYEATFRPSPLSDLTPAGREPDAFDRALATPPPARSRPRAADPLPPEALADPVRYAAQQCRPEVRPAGEGVAECFDRIDRAVAAEEARRRDARRPRATCSNRQSRDDEGRTTESSAHCVIGTGDPALAERLFGW